MAAPDSLILTYHSLDSSKSVISTEPAMFRRQMEWLAASGIPVVPVSEVQRQRPSVAITFDDGFMNFAEYAADVVAGLRLPVTVFVVTGAVGGDNDWDAGSQAIPQLPLLGWDELRGLVAQGVDIGSHTHTHPRLDRLKRVQLDREFVESQEAIQNKLGLAARTLAYPYGAANRAVHDAARKRFDVACGTTLGPVAVGADAMDLPRIDTYYLRDFEIFKMVVRRGGGYYLRVRRLLRETRQWLSP